MSDIFTPSKRSEIMSKVRSKGNRTTELRFIELMRRHGITGWRRNSTLPGSPDIIFPKQRVAVFIDGCFWHGCPRHFTLPENNMDFWLAKIGKNRTRDRRANAQLWKSGWRVIRIWEHALQKTTQDKLVARIRRALELI
ncbi:DNA mismatch endonuclease Vsr [Opitutaceae bacterium TAV4]|nr:DNA mismatch endonuclease Vsr [Opitutaceae bacterium TAV4]RRK00200.1 DNA mismatch endonuclease Vsr [Opitutaceae bacterium TAV3]RRK01989.1 DNA mismatch endonuclease Vsr [Opitutaceae bacterium TAV3]